jgi:hypothetical protein
MDIRQVINTRGITRLRPGASETWTLHRPVRRKLASKKATSISSGSPLFIPAPVSELVRAPTYVRPKSDRMHLWPRRQNVLKLIVMLHQELTIVAIDIIALSKQSSYIVVTTIILFTIHKAEYCIYRSTGEYRPKRREKCPSRLPSLQT